MAPAEGLYTNEILGRKGELCWDGLQALIKTLWETLFLAWGRYELDTTERLHFHFSLSRTGEGNGNPLQCSCLENPRDGGAWSAAIYGVTQSQTRLKQLSSSSSD